MVTTYRLHWKINERDANKTIKQFLQEQEISRRALTKIKYSGGEINVNGKGVTVRYQLQTGDMLEVVFPPETPSKHLQGEKLLIPILYEDEDILVLEKPSGISSIPSREHRFGTVANAITWHYENNGENRQIHIVTRLDRDTSGLMLVAKHRHAHHLLSKMQKNKEIERIYEAFASGVMQTSEGIIEAPIGRKETSIIEREVREDGQYACTRYKVLQQYYDFCHFASSTSNGKNTSNPCPFILLWTSVTRR